MTRLHAAPISLAEANTYVEKIHRHNGKLPSSKFAVALVDDDGLVHGVAIAGLPKARMLNDGGTLEVNRVCTDGARNACSQLYGACARAAKAIGYWRLVTYTLASEPGSSLLASGWKKVADLKGRSWKERWGDLYRDSNDTSAKVRWEIVLGERRQVVWPAGMTPDKHPSLFEEAS